MKASIEKLNAISQKAERLIIGLMSGTSLDGLDIALCKISGAGTTTKAEVLAFETIPYKASFKKELKQICFKQQVDLEQLCLLNTELGKLHGNLVSSFLRKINIHPDSVDLIASHGQTVFHSPKRLRPADDYGNATLQIGDADQIATITQIITVSDFRQKHVASGQEGAPLAIYGDYLLFRSDTENRILLNIGGISNFTKIEKEASFQDVMSTDAGPGNTLMDQYIAQHFPDKQYDDNANVARKGTVNQNLVDHLIDHSFFQAQLPKSTGPELFNLDYLEKAMHSANIQKLSHEDVMASLNYFTALGIANAVTMANLSGDWTMYISGGGFHNPLLRENIQTLLRELSLRNIADLGISADAKEAMLFALLANETVAGGEEYIFGKKAQSMGKISFPD